MMRQQLASISLDVREINAAKEAEKAEREKFLSNLQQLTTVFQKRTSSFIQFAADLHIRSDTRLIDLTESLATKSSTRSQPEVGGPEDAATVPYIKTRVEDESQNKGQSEP